MCVCVIVCVCAAAAALAAAVAAAALGAPANCFLLLGLIFLLRRKFYSLAPPSGHLEL